MSSAVPINEIANWTIILGYSSIAFFAFYMAFHNKEDNKKKRILFMNSITNKRTNDIQIDADEFIRMVEVSNIGKKTAEGILSELLLTASTIEDHNYYSMLVRRLEKVEPFGNLSKDMRVILERLYVLAENSGNESDRHLLIPIRNSIERADIVESEQKRTKKINFMLTIVGLISFAVSVGGLYVSIKSPSKEDIATLIKNDLPNIVNQALIEKKAP